jgi:four helix bundle protein
MPYNFEKPEVWHLALEFIDEMYQLAARLPKSEDFNLKSQITRAATSIALNIAEGSTGQTKQEFARFIGLANRSLVETVAFIRLIERRQYVQDIALLEGLDGASNRLSAKLQALRRSLVPEQPWLRESQGGYETEL